MWIIIRLLIGIVVLLIVEFYFIKHVNLAIKHFFPELLRKEISSGKKNFSNLDESLSAGINYLSSHTLPLPVPT